MNSCKLIMLEQSELLKLSANSISMNLRPGEFLFRQGSPLNSIIHLKHGLVKTFVEIPKRSNLIMNIYKSGTIMGIRGSLTNKIYNYSAVTIKESTICYINPATFIESLKSNTQFSLEILKILSAKSLSLEDKLQMHMQLLLPGKVANALLYLSENIYETESFKLPFTISELAQLIGASRERVSKVLNELKKDRVISMEAKNLSILNSRMLNSLCQLG